MNAQHLHHKPVAREFLHAITPMDFAPLHLPAKALSDDSCWDEYESEYEESLPNHVLYFFDEAARD
jgi:hypothetical protein